MEEDKRSNGEAGVAFAIFCFAVMIHNSFAPREFRQELNVYSMKCYGILLLIGLAIWFIVDLRSKK